MVYLVKQQQVLHRIYGPLKKVEVGLMCYPQMFCTCDYNYSIKLPPGREVDVEGVYQFIKAHQGRGFAVGITRCNSV